MPNEATSSTPVVNRLRGTLVEEVSLVDRAAIRRKFLLVKRETVAIWRRFLLIKKDNTMPLGAEIKPGPNGTLTATPPAATPTPAPPTPAATAAPTTTVKTTVSLTADAQAVLSPLVDQVTQMLANAKAMVDGAQVVEGEEQMNTAELSDVMMVVIESVEDAVYSLLGVDESEEAEGAPPPPHQGAPPPAPVDMAMSKRLEVCKAKRVLEKAEIEKSARTAVAKFGSKMAKKRLQQFKMALKMLGSLAKELEPTTKAAPPPFPPAKDDKKKVPGVPPPVATPAKKSDSEVSLEKRVDELASVVKAQAVELAGYRKAQATSNSVPVQGAPVRKQERVPFSWPVDMNTSFKDDKDSFGLVVTRGSKTHHDHGIRHTE